MKTRYNPAMPRLLFLLLVLLAAPAAVPCRAENSTTFIPYQLLSANHHDLGAFTQGLAWMQDNSTNKGRLFESTGRWGRSTVRELDPATGRTLRSAPLPAVYFGEGLAVYNNTLIQLTWKAERGFRRNPDTLKKISAFEYSGEGWGLALCPAPPAVRGSMNKPFMLVRSNGSPRLVFHDPDTFAEVGEIDIADRGEPVEMINELECVEHHLLFNIWHSDEVGIADLETGEVVGRIDFSPLRNELPEKGGALNGLAHDPANREIWVTGKNWVRLFKVRIPFLHENSDLQQSPME